MTHLHTLVLDVPRSSTVFCETCPIDLRLATYDEAVFIQNTNVWDVDNGPMVWQNGVVVVPRDFSLFQEAQ